LPFPNLKAGDVFLLNLTEHTGVSQNTIKKPHFVVIVMHPKKLENQNHKTIICVPMTSVHAGLWDFMHNRPRIQSHHCIAPGKYPKLRHDTLIKCEQIYTINREFFTDYHFTLDAHDLKDVRMRMFNIIGYGNF
jgi:mRNA-degrading endonuclease toxin of MazEF toxin-antitoxin module